MWPTAISQSIGRGNCLPCSARAVLADFGNGDHASENTLSRSRQSFRELLLRSAFSLDSWRKIAITLIDFGGKQDSGCKLLKNRLRAAWHQQKSSKIVL